MVKKPLKIAFCNSKGGTAKTASAQNISHALANKGKKVLLVDIDPQASLTYSFGIDPEECDLSIADVLLENSDIKDTLKPTAIKGVDIATGSLSLSSFDTAMSNDDLRETKLKDALDQVKGYDFILVDTPPTASLLMVNALLGVDRFIIPVTPEYLAMRGLATMMNVVDKVRGGYGKCASLLGIALTRADYRNKATHELVDLIRKHYKTQVFKSEIRVNVRVSEAPSHGKTVFQHDWASSGAESYKKLTDEILKKLKKEK